MRIKLTAGLAVAAALSSIALGHIPATASNVIVKSHAGLLQLSAPQESTNWSGYNQGIIEKNVPDGFHAITGDWIVPTATPHAEGESEFSSTWLGIGGGCEDLECENQDQTLIQTGTEQDVIYDALTGETTTEYSAWYELIPDAAITVPLPVHPGDKMRASIVETPIGSGQWTILLANVTQNSVFMKVVDYESDYGSAEWIAESPVVVAIYPLPPTLGFAPVPNLTPVRFDNVTVNGAPAALTEAEQIVMNDSFSGDRVATPSNPDAESDGFNDCTYTESCAAP